jgi:hypothetical protein
MTLMHFGFALFVFALGYIYLITQEIWKLKESNKREIKKMEQVNERMINFFIINRMRY